MSEKRIRDAVREVESVIPRRLYVFVMDYIEAMLFSSTDINGRPLNDEYSENDLSDELIIRFVADCKKFVDENYNDITDYMEKAAHDFWFTRNGHGVGFWDGDWEAGAGKRLTESCRKFKQIDVYIGDDGRLCGG